MPNICCVVGCNVTSTNRPAGVILHSFPNKAYESETREKWILAVKRVNQDGSTWFPQKWSKICSQHFVGGRRSLNKNHPAYIPTIFPRRRSMGTERVNRRAARSSKDVPMDFEAPEVECNPQNKASFETVSTQVNFGESDSFIFTCEKEASGVATQCTIPLNFGSSPVVNPCTTKPHFSGICRQDRWTQSNMAVSLPYAKKLVLRRAMVKDASCGPSSGIGPCQGFHGFTSIKDERELRSLCGIGRDAFNTFLAMITFKPSNILQNNCVLLLFLMKLKLGISFTALGVLMGVHRTTASNLFFSLLKFFTQTTRDKDIFGPDKFKGTKFENTKVIIDCTEVRCEKPQSTNQNISVYSCCKIGYSFKFLIDISPSCFISFKSSLYGGRTSDAYITNQCDILNRLKPGDIDLADKGLPHDTSTNVVNIVKPPFIHDGRLSRVEVMQTQETASARVQVEQCISRIKEFRILHKIPCSLLSRVDDVIHMCCVLVNHMSPIVKSDTAEEEG